MPRARATDSFRPDRARPIGIGVRFCLFLVYFCGFSWRMSVFLCFFSYTCHRSIDRLSAMTGGVPPRGGRLWIYPPTPRETRDPARPPTPRKTMNVFPPRERRPTSRGVVVARDVRRPGVRAALDTLAMPRGPKKHLKRLNAPKHWMLDKLGGVFAPKPSPGAFRDDARGNKRRDGVGLGRSRVRERWSDEGETRRSARESLGRVWGVQ